MYCQLSCTMHDIIANTIINIPLMDMSFRCLMILKYLLNFDKTDLIFGGVLWPKYFFWLMIMNFKLSGGTCLKYYLIYQLSTPLKYILLGQDGRDRRELKWVIKGNKREHCGSGIVHILTMVIDTSHKGYKNVWNETHIDTNEYK